MPIYYTVKPIKNNIRGGGEEKYYLMANSIGRIERKELLEDLAQRGIIDASLASAVLDYLYESIIRFLKMGYTIDLDDLGHILTTIKSKGSDTEGEADYTKVEDIKVHLVPGRKLRDAIRSEPVHKYPKLDKEYKSRHERIVEKIGEEIKQEERIAMANKCKAKGMPMEEIFELTGIKLEE
jgi:hypothetical protein